jgi:hypothetical protein
MPRHFSKQTFKNQAQQESIDNHNLFTAFTHMIGLSRFFSFTPNTPLQIWRDEMKDPNTPNHHSKQ